MGSLKVTVSVMQFLIFSSLLVAAHAQLVAYPNGAVAPFDPNNAAATKEHFAALAEAGAAVFPYNSHAQDLVVPAVAPGFYGKRSAQLVTYPNGAQAPFDPNVALATARHYAAKAAHGSWVPLEGAANVHPPAALPAPIIPAIYGRKKRSAEAQVLPYFATAYGLPLTPAYGLAPFAPLVAHPNGAVVPLEPKDVVEARAEHLEAVAAAVAA